MLPLSSVVMRKEQSRPRLAVVLRIGEMEVGPFELPVRRDQPVRDERPVGASEDDRRIGVAHEPVVAGSDCRRRGPARRASLGELQRVRRAVVALDPTENHAPIGGGQLGLATVGASG